MAFERQMKTVLIYTFRGFGDLGMASRTLDENCMILHFLGMASRTLDETACRAGVFRFQNIRIPKYSAYTLSLPDGTAAKFAFG